MSAVRPADREGAVEWGGDRRTWYRVTGDLGAGVPLVTLHGGPGCAHDYLLALADLAGPERAVVHHDQVGCGRSSHHPDAPADFWTVELFLDELDNLLTRLGIADNYALLGHSWGGLLAAQHASGRPAGLRGLVIACSPASYPLWLQEAKRLREQLPPGVNETLLRHEAAGTTDSDEYMTAMRHYYDRHVCRVTPWPREFMATFYEIYNDPTVYYTMNGPNEFHVIGTLKDWGVVDSCAGIEAPTLLLAGEHDEATPATMRPFHDNIPDVRWEIVENASHLPHLEEPEAFRAALGGFLKEVLG